MIIGMQRPGQVFMRQILTRCEQNGINVLRASWFFSRLPVVQAAGLVALALALLALSVEPRAFVYFRF